MAADKKNPNGITETFKTLFWALLLAGIIRTILFQPFWIPSGSMKPTLLIGDFLFVNKFTYGFSWASCPTLGGYNFCGFAKGWDGRLWGSSPERGDIIVFKHPSHEADFIKRLIGLPGDKLQVIKGRLHVNGQPVDLVDIPDFVETYGPQGPLGNMPRCANAPVGLNGDCIKQAALETLPNGVQHKILNINTSQGDNTPVFVVPEGNYFFMGDNRDNSSDSRFAQPYGVGLVPASYLVGRADRVIFSSAGSSILAFWTWRSDRFFAGLE